MDFFSLFRDRAFWECEHDVMPGAIIGPAVLKALGPPRPAFRRTVHYGHQEPIGPVESPAKPIPQPVAKSWSPKITKRAPWDGRTKKNSGKRKAKAAQRTHYVEARPKYSAWMHAYPGCAMDGG